jgi:CRISPR/Cas system-associated endoribonuclease Cas2
MLKLSRMKNRSCIIKSVLSLCGMALVSSTLAADRPQDPGVNARQRTQHNRVQQGVRSGELTAGEAKSLKQEEKVLRQEERAYKSDGKLTVAERKDLHQDANQLSRDIHRQKHDAQSKPAAAPLPPPLPPRRRDPLVNARQGAQQARIPHGIRSGELIRPEAAQLRQQEKAIRTEERAYKADGKLTPAERKDLRQDLNGTSKDIHQQKHDAQSRPNYPPSSSTK